MIKYPLFIIVYIVGISFVFAFLLIMSIIMILRGVFWDFRFQLGKDSDDDKLPLIELWPHTTHIPGELWKELKDIFNI